MAATQTKCVECGVRLTENRRRRHAVTCSARCAQLRQRRMDQKRYSPKHRMRCQVCRKWFRVPTKRSTCSAECEAANDRRIRPTAKNQSRRKRPNTEPSSSRIGLTRSSPPPPFGVTRTEAAERIGVSRTLVHLLCSEHGLGRVCNDGRFWLTLTELRTLTVRPWREPTK